MHGLQRCGVFGKAENPERLIRRFEPWMGASSQSIERSLIAQFSQLTRYEQNKPAKSHHDAETAIWEITLATQVSSAAWQDYVPER